LEGGTGKMRGVTKINDISLCFESFTDSLMNLNYVVWIEARSFRLAKHCKLNIKMLKTIFSKENNPIIGTLCKVGIEEARKHVNSFLTYERPLEATLSKVKDLDEIRRRVDMFWKVFGAHFEGEPSYVLKHSPAPGSFFLDYSFWGFCYVFIKDDYGLVVGAGNFF
jgi:hypothetical protein